MRVWMVVLSLCSTLSFQFGLLPQPMWPLSHLRGSNLKGRQAWEGGLFICQEMAQPPQSPYQHSASSIHPHKRGKEHQNKAGDESPESPVLPQLFPSSWRPGGRGLKLQLHKGPSLPPGYWTWAKRERKPWIWQKSKPTWYNTSPVRCCAGRGALGSTNSPKDTPRLSPKEIKGSGCVGKWLRIKSSLEKRSGTWKTLEPTPSFVPHTMSYLLLINSTNGMEKALHAPHPTPTVLPQWAWATVTILVQGGTTRWWSVWHHWKTDGG